MSSTMKSWPLRVSLLVALLLVASWLWLFQAKPALAADCTGSRYFVDQDATGSNTGADWANALTSLQDALTAAEGCPTITQVWVAEGLYTPGTVSDDTFLIRAGLAVYGGFAGTESNLNQRNWVNNVTVLSGDVGGNDTVDANGVVTTTESIVAPNAFHVVTLDGTVTPVASNTRLDGFVVTAGYAHTGFTDPHGGGLYCNGQGADGVCSPTIANVTFSGNSAEEFGGAVANIGHTGGTSSPTLNNVTFTGNMASAGGAMVNFGSGGTSNPALTDVTFTGNKAINAAGALLNLGDSGTSSPTLTRVTFTNNSIVASNGMAGAMLNDGQFFGVSSPKLTDVTFTGNSSTRDGGAVVNRCSTNGTSSPVFNRVTFANNSAVRFGGAMRTEGMMGTCSPKLTNVLFLSNTAGTWGGGMHNTGFSEASMPVLINVTFAGNSGTAMVNELDSPVVDTFPISNTIFYGNDDAILNIGGVVPRIRHSLVQDSGGSGAGWNGSPGLDGGSNIDANARFVDGASGNVRLRSDSPAIDAGDNAVVPEALTTDIAGAPRIFDGDGDGTATVDMGAYERTFHDVDVVRSGTGSGSVSSAPAGINCGADCTETLDFGTVITLTATANSASDFDGWLGDCSGQGVCQLTVNATKQVTATFTLKQYTINVSANPSASGLASGGGSFTHGETVTLTAIAQGNYVFVNWTEDGTEVSTEPSFSFTATANRALVANFIQQYTIGLSASPNEGGAVSGGGTVTHGETVTVTAIAEGDYVFVNWTEDGAEVSTEASYSFTATADRTLVANFSNEVVTPGKAFLPLLRRSDD